MFPRSLPTCGKTCSADERGFISADGAATKTVQSNEIDNIIVKKQR